MCVSANEFVRYRGSSPSSSSLSAVFCQLVSQMLQLQPGDGAAHS